LTAATPQFENPHYVDPDLSRTWQLLLRQLPLEASPRSPRRIFVSRRPEAKRQCHQARQIERFFARHRFLVFYPEDLPFVEQARLFSGAEIVAGFGGSGMFTMLLAPTARVILISGDGYNAENEHLIAAVNGNDLHYFWGRSDLRPESHGQGESSRSAFSFNLREHKRALRRLLR
jgi:capsular polysaccharide biosynthesis protein